MSTPARIILRSANHPDFDPKEEGEEPAAVVTTRIIPPPREGLGDWVEKWAKPIGCRIDRWTSRLPGRMAKWKTGLCGCSACSGRRVALNAFVPDYRHWKGGWQTACTTVARSLLALIDRMF